MSALIINRERLPEEDATVMDCQGTEFLLLEIFQEETHPHPTLCTGREGGGARLHHSCEPFGLWRT